jgi:DnaK suppressor protein
MPRKSNPPPTTNAATRTATKPAIKRVAAAEKPVKEAPKKAVASPGPTEAKPVAAAKKAVPAGKAAVPAKATSPAKSGPVSKVAPPTKRAGSAVKTKAKGDRAEFLAEQRQLLLEERATYIGSAETLKAQADSLALEHEPGDVQFDEEGGEGGTANVDREIDLYLSGQARATVVEIDRALEKIDEGNYGPCEQCGQPIPDARLQALPYAALCVACKSGGLSSRR